jgi:hypothetical protein
VYLALVAPGTPSSDRTVAVSRLSGLL